MGGWRLMTDYPEKEQLVHVSDGVDIAPGYCDRHPDGSRSWTSNFWDIDSEDLDWFRWHPYPELPKI